MFYCPCEPHQTQSSRLSPRTQSVTCLPRPAPRPAAPGSVQGSMTTCSKTHTHLHTNDPRFRCPGRPCPSGSAHPLPRRHRDRAAGSPIADAPSPFLTPGTTSKMRPLFLSPLYLLCDRASLTLVRCFSFATFFAFLSGRWRAKGGTFSLVTRAFLALGAAPGAARLNILQLMSEWECQGSEHCSAQSRARSPR